MPGGRQVEEVPRTVQLPRPPPSFSVVDWSRTYEGKEEDADAPLPWAAASFMTYLKNLVSAAYVSHPPPEGGLSLLQLTEAGWASAAETGMCISNLVWEQPYMVRPDLI